MKNTLLLLSLSIWLPSILIAQDIYPIPQYMVTKGENTYRGVKNNDEDLGAFYNRKGIAIREIKDKTLLEEGYNIKIDAKRIYLTYATDRGRFYAMQSLNQILSESKLSGKLPNLMIKDQPDIKFRGTVEGFYGKPWSHEDRIAQLRFYGANKLNTYIYGPKDDPYHSSPKWREAYPSEDGNKLKELVSVAKQNQVDFYWAIHPGLDIKWNKSDSLAVLNKFDKMYDLGVRHFAVFFDDISGEGTKAEKQAGLLNFLQTEFIDVKKDVGALIMCPTEYNKGWSNHKEGTYLDILGNQLDPRIHVMWTGNTVIHDITKEGQEWVNKRIKRPSFVWWNFPVSDYVRNHLLLGPSYGLDKDAKADMSGFVSNPMDKPEASKVAVFSIANYAWNLKAYDSNKTWEVAIDRIVPEVKEEYKLFSSHNADPGPSYHQYRRDESKEIADILNPQLKNLEEGKGLTLSNAELERLRIEFEKFPVAAQAILHKSNNKNLVAEIKPWLDYFAIQGEAASYLLKVVSASNNDIRYENFEKFQSLRDRMIEIDQTQNRNPYQPGIVTASRYVLPWMEQSYLYFHKSLKEAGFKVKDAVNQPIGKIFTNIIQLNSLPVQNAVQNGNRPLQVLKLGRLLEYVPFKIHDYVGIEIESNSKIKEVKYRFDDKVEGFSIEYSQDGQSWNKEKNSKAKYVRLINNSDSDKSVRIQSLEIIFE